MKTDFDKLLLQESPDAVIATNTEGEILYWSKGAETIFAYSSAATLRPQAECKGLAFSVSLPAPALVLNTDRRALVQIVINLTGNAIKFTERGNIHLSLSQRSDGREQGYRNQRAG